MTLDSLTAAVELHRPVSYDKYAYETTDPKAATRWRCTECGKNVTKQGCRTWQTANA